MNRHHRIWHRYVDVIPFDDGASPWIADAVAWLSFAVLYFASGVDVEVFRLR